MANLDNLGYNTYVLGTIKSVTESKRIIVYDSNVFINYDSYSRINLYNLTDIYYSILYNKDDQLFNPHCLPIERNLDDSEEFKSIPFEYDCSNIITNGFNVIIYLDDNNNPTGYTEFLNIQGRVSNFIRIYLKFEIKINQIVLELNNSLYKVKNRLSKNFIGQELNKFPSSSLVKSKINGLPKNQQYTSHLSNFLRPNNTSGIILGDGILINSGVIKKLDFLHDINILEGESYDRYQIGFYGDDVVLYAWSWISGVGYYYRITSLLEQKDYKNTRINNEGEYVDTVSPYDSEREQSKELLYCAGKYLVFRIFYRSSNFTALYDTSTDSWVKSSNSNVIVDPLDREAKIYELPKSRTIQSFDTAIELFPEISDTFLDIKSYIQTDRSLEVIQKFGDWFILRKSNLYLFTCPSISIWMTYDEYRNCIIVNNNTILLKDSNYYVIYHGPQKKIYYTEKAKCILLNKSLQEVELRDSIIQVCDNEYINAYKNSEIAIVFKDSLIYNSFLNSYRHQSLLRYQVPSNIIGAVRGIIFYLDQYNNINYI